MVRPSISRRAALAFAAAVLAGPAMAAADPGSKFIREVQAQFARAAPVGKPGNAAELERIVTRAFDMDAIARAVLGSKAAGASAAQIRRLGRAYVKRVVRDTLERRRKAKTEGAITGSKPAGPDQWLVTTRSMTQQNEPVILAWKVRRTAGTMKIVDVLRDGSSLVNSERRTVQIALRTRTLDAVIAELERKYARPAA